ncbi:MAG: hypothetical protein M1817_005665 [Caeruleum heppii]|nr:MAG: hypothetical protein M1817_005665 [Caeruleum heppii]
MDSRYYAAVPDTVMTANNEMHVLLEDMSRQMASSRLVRRSSSRQAAGPSTGTMRRTPRSDRISKATSAGNSPRDLDRRRSVAYDTRARQMPLMTRHSNHGYPLQQRHDLGHLLSMQDRPLSWHPSQRLHDSQPVPAIPSLPPQTDSARWSWMSSNAYSAFNGSPAPSLYPCSDSFSPVIPMSPLNGPFDDSEQFSLPNSHLDLLSHAEEGFEGPWLAGQEEPKLGALYGGYGTSIEEDLPSNDPRAQWSCYAPVPDDISSAPLFSDDFLPIQHPEPVKTTDPQRPFSSSQPQPEKGELIGMGLYDAPEREPTPDPELQLYRQQLHGLFGASASTNAVAGRGLKLEETWTPQVEAEELGDESGEEENEENESLPYDGENETTVAETRGAPVMAAQGALTGGSFLLDEGDPVQGIPYPCGGMLDPSFGGTSLGAGDSSWL